MLLGTCVRVSPELDVSLICPEDFPPLALSPRPLPLGPVKAALPLSLRKVRLGGGHPAGDAELLGDDTADGPLVDFHEPGDLEL